MKILENTWFCIKKEYCGFLLFSDKISLISQFTNCLMFKSIYAYECIYLWNTDTIIGQEKEEKKIS